MRSLSGYLFAAVLIPLTSFTVIADSDVLSCAQGAVLAALVDHRLEVDTPHLIAAFPAEYQLSSSATPMNVVCDVLRHFGLTAYPVQFDTSRNSTDWARCILLFDADKEAPGHFVYVKSVIGNQVTIVDPRHTTAEHVLTFEQLFGYWNGYAVVVGSRGLSSPVWYLTPLLIAVIAALGYSGCRSRRAAIQLCCVSALWVGPVGCTPSSTELVRAIEFKERIVVLKDLSEGATVRIVLPLLIHDAVILKTVKASCSCARVMNEVEGEVFAAGEVCEIELSVFPGVKSELGFDVFVESHSGATARVNVAGIVEQIPRVSENVIVSEYVAGMAISLAGQVLVERTKPHDTPRMTNVLQYVGPDDERVEVEIGECTEVQIRYTRTGEQISQEQCRWNWRVTADGEGQFQNKELLFKYGEHKIPVQLRFEELPPMKGLTRSVYCGKLLAGADWERTFNLCGEQSEHVVIGFTGDPGLTAVVGSISDDRQELFVTLNSPNEPGKFRLEGRVEIAGLAVPYKIDFLGEVEVGSGLHHSAAQ